jgi:nucleotide-binding universal stress UspA family protein
MNLDERSVKVLKVMLNIEHSGLEVVHIIEKQDGKPPKEQEDKLSNKLGEIPHMFHYIHDKNVPRAIKNFLESINANGLVTVAHEHSLMRKLFVKSVSKSLAYEINVPMLVLHG